MSCAIDVHFSPKFLYFKIGRIIYVGHRFRSLLWKYSEGMAWKFSWWCILITTRNIFCVRFVDCGHFSAISIQKKIVIVNYVISTLISRLCLAHLNTKLLRNFYTIFILLKSLIPGKKHDLFAFSKLGYNILPVAIVLYVVGRRPMSYDWFRTLANGNGTCSGFPGTSAWSSSMLQIGRFCPWYMWII